MIQIGEITLQRNDLYEAFKELEALKANGVLPIQNLQHWLNLHHCLLPDCKAFIKHYQRDCACQYPDCVCKMTCTCGKCTFCDVQKFQNLYDKFDLLVEYHSNSDSCFEAILDYPKSKYWKRKYYKLYDKLVLFHYHFDKDFDTPGHSGSEGRVFVNDEIEVVAEDFGDILNFLRLYDEVA